MTTWANHAVELFTMAGWPTPTTRDRLNGILDAIVYQHDGAQYVQPRKHRYGVDGVPSCISTKVACLSQKVKLIPSKSRPKVMFAFGMPERGILLVE